MNKIAFSSLVSLMILSCSVTPNTQQTQEPSSYSRLTTHNSLLQDTSTPSLVTRPPSLNLSDLEKEYKSFSTKALSDAYVKRMFGKYLGGTPNPVQLIRQLEFSRYLKNNGDNSFETSLKRMFRETPSLYTQLTGIGAIQTKMTNESATFGAFVQNLQASNKSCLALKSSGINANGVFAIDPDNNASTAEINVYCDMTTDGGGWTLVTAQYENDPVSWNEGIQSDYDPSLTTKNGFSLNSSQLPVDRTQTGFGKDLLPTDIDYIDFIYSTADIPVTTLNGKKTSYSYQIHRSSTNYYDWHNPEESINSSYSEYYNTLTFDRTEGRYLTWVFTPFATLTEYRGCMYNGQALYSTHETSAWTVWVR